MAMLAEESSELAVSALHFLRHSKPRDQALEDLAEELVDTRLMIEQIIYIIPELERKVPIIEARKLARLAELLK
jgi:HEPN domain-containing protein